MSWSHNDLVQRELAAPCPVCWRIACTLDQLARDLEAARKLYPNWIVLSSFRSALQCDHCANKRYLLTDRGREVLQLLSDLAEADVIEV